MNVLFITHYTGLGGASVALLNLIDGLKKEKREINIYVLLPRKGDLEYELTKRSIEYDFIPFCAGVISRDWTCSWKYPLKQIKNSFFQIYSALKICPFIKKWNINIIHANSTYVLCGTLAGKFMKIRSIWHLRENISGQFNAVFFPVPFLVKWIFNKTDRIISVSKYISDIYSDYNDKIITIYDGTHVHLQKDKFDIHGIVKILYTGALNTGKGIFDIPLLCKAMDSIELEEYLIYMVGVDKEKLEYFAKKNDWDPIILDKLIPVSRFSRQELDEFRNKMDFFFMPSPDEALGLVTTEAMMMGLPVVGVDSGATKELIGNNERGYKYSSGNYIELGGQIQLLLGNRYERLKRIEMAKKWGEENFTVEICSKKIYELYVELVDKVV